MTARPGVTTWYLEMTDASQLRPATPVDGLSVERIDPPDPELSARMYDASAARGSGPTASAGTSSAGARTSGATWSRRGSGGSTASRSATRRSGASGDEVEVASFGLLPGFPGRGLGGALLAAVIADAWERGARRVWLHTCSLDSPAALPSYERRGFRRYHEEVG